MEKFLVRIISKTIVEGEGEGCFYRLQILNNDGIDKKSIEIPLNGNHSIGDLIEINFKNLAISKSVTFNFLHHFDRPNQGDILSGPYHYFDFPSVNKISWDSYVINNSPSVINHDGVTIIGGGIYFTDNKPRLKNLALKSKAFIAWGIGLDPRADTEKFIDLCKLVGTRERNSKFIDNKKVFYVPCSSCMHKSFDTSSLENMSPNNEVALHLNGGFNEKLLLEKFPGAPLSTTVDGFEKIIKNLMNTKCIVTNSYHGAYWGSLLGKKVVCLKTKVPKWDGLSKDVIFSEIRDIDRAILSAKSVSADYLNECRELNREFYSMIKNKFMDFNEG